MRIDRLSLKNFKCFAEREISFHPQFNLIVGENGSGKTAVLDALAVATGSWLLGIRGQDSRHIRPEEVRLCRFDSEGGATWERQFPCEVSASGEIGGRELSWSRSLHGEKGRTKFVDAREVKSLAETMEQKVRAGEGITLPVLSNYGTSRLWNVPREHSRVNRESGPSREKKSRLAGYSKSVNPGLSPKELVDWVGNQEWMKFREGGVESRVYRAVRDALLKCVYGATNIEFDPKLGEIVATFENRGAQPFTNLSDGQRALLAMVGDIAQKMATLNPHLNGNVLSETPGVVLIDELDLHLHPKWQRMVIDTLRQTFPQVQFICTTHSPFLIQALHSGEELVMLDGVPTAQLADMSIEEIAQGIQGVENIQTSVRYLEMKTVARDFLEALEQAELTPKEKLEAYKQRLASSLAPYADNPAFQAFLEMQRAAKLGE